MLNIAEETAMHSLKKIQNQTKFIFSIWARQTFDARKFYPNVYYQTKSFSEQFISRKISPKNLDCPKNVIGGTL